MNADEGTERFKETTADERPDWRADLERERCHLEARIAEINHELSFGPNKVDQDFKKMADHVFTKNAELFRKLAQ